jgi:threonine/homoserine/homoserine lactone efflux protein
MGRAIGSILPLAAAIAIFPVPIIAVVLVLASDRGRAKGLAFVAAWAGGLAAVGAIVLALSGALGASEGGEPATWMNVVLLVLGAAILAAAVKAWRGRPRGDEEPPVPGWMRTIGDFTVAKAAATGFALTAVNPKNLLLTVAAAAKIADVGLPAGQEAVVLAVFVVLASVGVLAPLVATVALGERSGDLLDGVRAWMARNNAVIMAVLFVLIGAKLVGDALVGFSG